MVKAEIRPNPGVPFDAHGRCEDTDEVVGTGILHVEQMNKNCYWARLDLPDGKAIVMWFNARGANQAHRGMGLQFAP